MYKKAEFKAFIKLISQGQTAHWIDIADALGVDPDTITKWKKEPEAQEAILKGIDHALQCMEQAGARDWRMWEAKLKMLGINPPTKVEAKHDIDPIEKILDKFGLGGADAGQTKGAEETTPQSDS